ncbi:MAG: right-handed parallel beta-helix repeat-containing protein, partial [Candidatus Thorarchaeota archaeon]|nr:right-handed parallel beta-helix repeat-containing protein [Candidatus Thorarchaeota archaeon]
MIIAFSSSEGVTVIKGESIVAQTNVQSMTPSGDYTPHGSIIISSNAGFSSQGWPGSGTPADPFIIEWLNLTHYDTCISIRNTDVYFEIRNCLISYVYMSAEEGIHFVNVMHGTIFNCIIEQHHFGASLYNSDNCILSNNTAINNRFFGFRLERSDACTLTNNTITNSDNG